jgi:hypothetical protein
MVHAQVGSERALGQAGELVQSQRPVGEVVAADPVVMDSRPEHVHRGLLRAPHVRHAASLNPVHI